MKVRTVLHGTCLLGGNHPAGSLYAAECPVLQAEARRARAQAAAQTRWEAADRPRGTPPEGRIAILRGPRASGRVRIAAPAPKGPIPSPGRVSGATGVPVYA